MIETIVFDFGNVIGHFDRGIVTERLMRHAGVPADVLAAYLFGGRLEENYESGRLSTEAFLRQLREACRIGCPDDELGAALADMFRPNPEVCDLVPRLKPRYRLFLLSNTNDLHARQFRRQFADTLRHFDALVLSHEVGVRKPAPGIYEHCRRLAGCAPSGCVFIDDLPENVQGAVDCGWHGVVYTGAANLRRRLEELGVAVG